MKKVILSLMILSGVVSYSQTKQAKIKEFISLNGSFPLSKEVEKQLILDYKKKYSNIPESAWSVIEKKVNVDDLINKVVDIYGSRFNENEIDQLLVFYKSDLGKKLIQNSSYLISEIQTANSDWGMNVTKTINSDLEKMGYLESPPPPMPSKSK